MTRHLAPLLALALAGCGLHPLYSGGVSGGVAATLRTVEVGPIEGRVGWLVRNKLVDRLGEAGTASPRFRLDVKLDDNITGFGIRGDRAATRERRTLRARYQLVSIPSGTVVLDATAGSDAGIDVVSSEYATVAAEQTAAERLADVLADQIVARLGAYAMPAPEK
jgi:LPS-assembly lipoprotein